MAKYDCDWVDAFTDVPFGGNGCAVVHDALGMDDATCMAFVRETSLTECTFVGPSSIADFQVRYFLAGGEIPFAGHPTIATVAALIHRDKLQARKITLETKAGIIPIEIDDSFGHPRIIMTQNAPQFGPKVSPENIAAIGGISADDIIGTPQIVSTGLPFCITVLRDHDALARVALQPQPLQAFQKAGETFGVMEPFWVTSQGATDIGDTFARLPMAPPNPPEDPFTGSATGAMAAYLWRYAMIEDRNFIAEQGHWMGRPGHAQVQVLGPQRDIQGVRVAGTGHILMSGTLFL
jgi:trans-2,3-dihydro-3-hydroxyanthranilate isomerase